MDRLLIGAIEKLVYWDGERADVVYETTEPFVPLTTGPFDGLTTGRIFGVTWDREHIFVVTSQHLGQVVVFDGQWREVGVIPFGDGVRDPHPHQALWWAGTLYIALTGYHAIACYDGEKTTVEWPGRFCDKDGSDPHVNSIWSDGQSLYVVEHWRDKLPKKVRRFDLNWTLQETWLLGEEAFGGQNHHGIHNVYVEDGYLYTLAPRQAIGLCLETGETETVAGALPGYYLRGLARTEDAFYVGMSLNRRVRKERAKGDAAVMVLDGQWQERGIITLQDVGQIHEVRALRGDRAHNGIDCPFRG